MSDSEQGGASAAFPGPSATTTLAALTTILLATGSALLIRSKRLASAGTPLATSTGGSEESFYAVPGNAGQTTRTNTLNDSKESRLPRTKERRRRGKDPVKEILKGGKRGNKLLLKLSKAAEDMHIVGEHASMLSSAESEAHPNSNEAPTTPGRSRDTSLTPSKSSSSRSVSASSSSRNGGGRLSNRLLNEHCITSHGLLDSFDGESETSHSRGASTVPSSSRSVSVASRDNHDIIFQPSAARVHTSDAPLFPEMTPTSPTSTTKSTDSGTPSVSTPTPPSFFVDAPNLMDSGGIPEDAQTTEMLPSSPSLPANVHRKPSGFSSQNSLLPPSSPESSPSLDLSSSLSRPYNQESLQRLASPYDPSPSCSPPSSISSISLASSSSAALIEDEALPITFPTLNPQPALHMNLPSTQQSLPSSSTSSPKPTFKPPVTESTHGNGISGPDSAGTELALGSGITALVGNSRNGRQGHTPRRTPTPSSQSGGTHTPPLSLSAQTQIASLRGALEAARLREDKTRLEMEQRSKDLEALRWESVAWRQREAELQNQILHLTHHLQAYTTYHASMSSPVHPPTLPAPHQLQHLNINNKAHHFRISNTPSPAPSPTRLHAAPQVNGMLSPMPSPLSQTTPNSHMFPYPATPSPSTPGHTIPASYLQSPPVPPSSLFSVLFPLAGSQPSGATGPSSTSRSGDSSVGSMSPVLGGPAFPPLPTAFNRGRQRSRFWNGGETDDWIETASSSHDDNTAREELNSVLADAILKRPDSIRRGASNQSAGGSQSQGVREEESTEFTFPSLSDFGLGVRRPGTRSPDGDSLGALSNAHDNTSESLSAKPETQPLRQDVPMGNGTDGQSTGLTGGTVSQPVVEDHSAG